MTYLTQKQIIFETGNPSFPANHSEETKYNTTKATKHQYTRRYYNTKYIKLQPGLVALYNVLLGNGLSLFLKHQEDFWDCWIELLTNCPSCHSTNSIKALSSNCLKYS